MIYLKELNYTRHFDLQNLISILSYFGLNRPFSQQGLHLFLCRPDLPNLLLRRRKLGQKNNFLESFHISKMHHNLKALPIAPHLKRIKSYEWNLIFLIFLQQIVLRLLLALYQKHEFDITTKISKLWKYFFLSHLDDMKWKYDDDFSFLLHLNLAILQ